MTRPWLADDGGRRRTEYNRAICLVSGNGLWPSLKIWAAIWTLVRQAGQMTLVRREGHLGQAGLTLRPRRERQE